MPDLYCSFWLEKLGCVGRELAIKVIVIDVYKFIASFIGVCHVKR